MKTPVICLVTILALLAIPDKAFAQHYTDWTGFEFTKRTNEANYYELQKDYTISLPEYFLDKKKLPVGARFLVNDYRSWALSRPAGDWDFVRLEPGGIITVKKGYRWDGPSYPLREHSDHNYRSSLIHDALYDLMRMGYLEADHFDFGDPVIADNPGDHNRKMADMLLYMIAVEDGQSKTGFQGAYADYKIVRLGGAGGTHNDNKLEIWKYHVSEMTAYASDGKIELEWKRADDAAKDPKYSDHFDPPFKYDILRDGQTIATVDAYEWLFPNPPVFTTSYTDSAVVNGVAYEYQVLPHADNNNQHDHSHIDIAVPMSGPGNALILDGINDFVEANAVSNDLCYNTFFNPMYTFTLEAWVYPQQQNIHAVIMAFNDIAGYNFNLISYNGSTNKFYYYDDIIGYVGSADEFPSGIWYHVALTLNEHFQGSLYVNGTPQATFNTSIKPRHGARFSIGQEWDGSSTSQHFKGLIDEVRIWAKVRTETELLADMNHPLHGEESGLVGLWHFDEPANYKLAWESTVNANNGYLSGYQNSEDPFVTSCAMAAGCSNTDDTVYVDIIVDIKPGSCPNPLNARGNQGNGNGQAKSVLPVAILGTEAVDVSDINPATISLAGVSPIRWSYEDVATPSDKTDDSCACTEEAADGHEDLTIKFNRQALIEAIKSGDYALQHDSIGTGLYRDEIKIRLTAELNDGTALQGYDCVIFMTKDTIDNPSQTLVDETPISLALLGSHPNPFNSTTQISFSLSQASYVRIEIFNLLGQKVETLVDGHMEAGYHSVEWYASHLASGMYLYRLQSGDFIETKKMLLLR